VSEEFFMLTFGEALVWEYTRAWIPAFYCLYEAAKRYAAAHRTGSECADESYALTQASISLACLEQEWRQLGFEPRLFTMGLVVERGEPALYKAALAWASIPPPSRIGFQEFTRLKEQAYESLFRRAAMAVC
jgi:hypothetical protein